MSNKPIQGVGFTDHNKYDHHQHHHGIHPEYQRRIYIWVNPPLLYPLGHHHYHVGEEISVNVHINMAQNRPRDEVHFLFLKTISSLKLNESVLRG